MLREMEAGRASFSIEWCTIDRSRRKGGKLMQCEQMLLKRNGVRKGKRTASAKPEDTPQSQWFKLYDVKLKRYHTIYKRLITRFNGKEVIY